MPDTVSGLGPSLTRSRSRYRGTRPDKTSQDIQTLPSLTADQTQNLRLAAFPRNEPRKQSDCAKPKENQDRAERDSSQDLCGHRRSEGRAELQASAHPPLQLKTPRHGDFQPHTAVKERNPIPDRRMNADVQDPRRGLQPALQSQYYEDRSAAKSKSVTLKKSFTQRVTRHRDLKSREQLKRTISGPIAIEASQTTITPAFDAPISAVNSGERRVTVTLDRSTLSLPVTPSTTSLDIIRLAAEQIDHVTLSRDAVLVESFRQLALERPLRRYEHIRDVLNSWDTDTQNTLSVQSSPVAGEDKDLDLGAVPRTQPEETSVMVYHSQKPGHWNKRITTLRADGQISVAKKDGTENICHLSDFDIYIPTARQLSKKIKPPRKICFAIKSQQKSSMFMTTINFVHFFSTSDKRIAATWYKAVQAWRSWYLVNVMGEGRKESNNTASKSTNKDQLSLSRNHTRTKSQSRVPSNNPNSTAETTHQHHAESLPVRRRGAPPLSYPDKFMANARVRAAATSEEELTVAPKSNLRSPELEPFTASGLLGRTYTHRQKAQQARETAQKSVAIPSPPPGNPSTQPKGLKRSSSQRQQVKPLIDLTPQYREAPQHLRKGRGFIPEHVPAGGLVEIATSPENAVEVPPTTTWQRPSTSGRDKVDTIQHNRTVREDRGRGSPPASNPRQPSASPEKANGSFTGGLLANNKGQGRSHGR